MKNVVLILPTYNERGNIVSLIEEIEKITKKLDQYNFQILVVDDYSPDGTGTEVKKIMTKYSNIKLISKTREGLGAAIVYGMNYAFKNLKPEILMQMDADWSHNPNLIPQFIKKSEEGSDFVIGSRYIKGGSIPTNWGIHRKIFSLIGNVWVRFGLGILSPHDWSSGFRMVKSNVAEKVYRGLGKYSGYTFQIAFLHRVKRLGYSVSEVPLIFVDRVHGRSKFPAFDYIKNVIFYVINNSTFLKYIIIGVVGFSIQAVIFQLLNLVGLFPGISVMIGSFFAIITNFLGNNIWTFGHKKITGIAKLLKKFGQFFTTSIGAIIIQGVVVTVGVVLMGRRYEFWYMVFAIIFLVIPYNYFIYNRFIWKTHQQT